MAKIHGNNEPIKNEHYEASNKKFKKWGDPTTVQKPKIQGTGLYARPS